MEAEQKLKEKLEKEGTVKQETSPIVLSVLMTKDEIIDKLGSDFTFRTEAGGFFGYDSVLEYDGISFTYCHDKNELPSNALPDIIRITSSKYVFNYNFKVGDSALDAIEYCENSFENAYDRHWDRYIFDVFNYKEKKSTGELAETGHLLGFEYESENDYSSKDELGKDVKIKTINIFVLFT